MVLAVAERLAHIGFLLLLIPELQVAYSFATPLLIDKKLTPWQVTKRPVSGVASLVSGLLVSFFNGSNRSCIVPYTDRSHLDTFLMWFIGYTLLYRNIFGLERE